MSDDAILVIDDEVLLIENGGELPEVAMYGCLYFLRHDPDGLGREPSAEEARRLKLAVVEGYRRIIVRDLTLANRGQGHYRGLARCLVNWGRMRRFCKREGIDPGPVAAEMRDLLSGFIAAEREEFLARRLYSQSLNCSAKEIIELCQQIGLHPVLLPPDWQLLIPA